MKKHTIRHGYDLSYSRQNVQNGQRLMYSGAVRCNIGTSRPTLKIHARPIDFESDLCYIGLCVSVWVWRRLVARYLGVVEAAGSTPVTQTM